MILRWLYLERRDATKRQVMLSWYFKCLGPPYQDINIGDEWFKEWFVFDSLYIDTYIIKFVTIYKNGSPRAHPPFFIVQHSWIHKFTILSHLILETLEDQLSLLILVLSNSVFSFEFVVLHWFRVIKINVLGMEHMSTEIQHCSFVNFSSFIFRSIDLRVIFDKLADFFHKIAVLLLNLKIFLFWEVRKTNQKVHQNWNLKIADSYQSQHGLHKLT